MKKIAHLVKKSAYLYFMSSNPEKIVERSKKRLVSFIKKAAHNIPAYRKILAQKGIDITLVKDYESFKKFIPKTDKTIFCDHGLASLCLYGNIYCIKSATASSGSSQIGYSFGLYHGKSIKGARSFSDIFADIFFDTHTKKNYIISCLGLGTRVHSSLPISEVGLRSDVAVQLLKKIPLYFDHIIIVSGTYFAKKLIEEAAESGIDWKSTPATFIIGEDWFPENYRGYLAHLLGADDSSAGGKILSTFGICEVGTGIFFESMDLVRIRYLAEKDAKLRKAIFGDEAGLCSPILFHYNPMDMFIEEDDGELLLTSLNNNTLIPLMRYTTYDRGKIHRYEDIKNILIEFNYGEYIPKWTLPLVSVMGRKNKYIKIHDKLFTPEHVKHSIYSDFKLAATTTGNFHMSNVADRLHIEIQSNKNIVATDELSNGFKSVISRVLATDIDVVLYNYKDFPCGMELNYEHKFKYI